MNYFDVLFAKKQSGGGGTPTLITKTITENGTYNASEDNADGYSQVTVAVEGLKKKSIANTPTDIASFDDGTANPMPSLEISIEPVQAGSGDPSPSNVRPISGWNEANVTKCGVNLFDKDSTTVSNVTFKGPSGTATRSGFELTLPNGNYSLKCFGATVQNYIYIYKNNAGNYIDVYMLSVTGGWQNVNISVNTGDVLYVVAAVQSTTLDLNFDLDIIAGTTPPTTYSPYQGSTLSIPFRDSSDNPITVYGGTLDVTSGVLTASGKTLSDDTQIADARKYNNVESNYCYFFNRRYIDGLAVNGILTSSVVPLTNEIPINDIGISEIGDYIYVNFGQLNENTVTGFRLTWREKNMQILYELATPQTYQLTPAQVTTLLGQNNIFADCGQILEGEYFVTL